MRIAQVASLAESAPPKLYGGGEFDSSSTGVVIRRAGFEKRK
jgi:hypothetical protein